MYPRRAVLHFASGALSVLVAIVSVATAAPTKSGDTSILSPQGSIVLNGYAVNPSRVLVRWNSINAVAATPAAVEAALQGPEARALGARPTTVSARAFAMLDGVGYIEFADTAAWRSTALSKKTGVARADALNAAASSADIASALQLKHRMAVLRATGLFAYVEPDYIQRAYAAPSDSAFVDGRQWGLRNTGQDGGVAGIDIQAVDAWDVTTGSDSVIVAVIDSGIRYTHQDLAGNMWRNPGEIANNGIDDDGNGIVDDVFGLNSITDGGDPMDDNGHGSHCAGTIGATANDAGDLAGVAWNVRLMALKFLGANAVGANSDALECIDYAVAKGAHIISGSYGGGGPTRAAIDAIERAREAGILCVFAAGNEHKDNDANPDYPASYPNRNIIAVASIDRTGQLAASSNYGASSVDIAAPGVRVFSCDFQNDAAYQTISGTSMATPYVSGVAALIKARFPSENFEAIKERILVSARPLPALRNRVASGGFVQARAALDIAADGTIEIGASAVPLPLHSGEPVTIDLRISDLGPILGATATGSLGSVPIVFRDDGVGADTRANDGTYTVRTTVPAVPAGEILLSVSITAPGKLPFSGSSTLPVVVKPENDDFANATNLDLAAIPLSASNLAATRQTGEPNHAGNAGGKSLWWWWTAPSNGEMQISTTGSAIDTTLAVYTGPSLPNLVEVASNDDIGQSDQTSRVAFAASQGTTYWIAVDGFDGEDGDIVLNAAFTPAAGGAEPPQFVRQPANSTVTYGETIHLSVEVAGSPAPTLRWERDGVMLADDGRITGATTADLSIADSTLRDGGDYRAVATNPAGTVESLIATVTVNASVVRPDNDDFANRAALVGAAAQANGSNTGATAESLEPAHAGVSARRSVWWTWTAPATGMVDLDTSGSAFDTVLAVYRGNSVATLTHVASNNDAAGGRQSRVTFTAEAGVQYAIAVDSASTRSGAIALNLSQGGAIGLPPAFAWQPVNTTVIEGFEAALTALAGGTPPLTYRWWKNGSPIDGADEPFLIIPAAQLSDAGGYRVVVSNAYGQTASTTAQITVDPISRPPNDDREDAMVISIFGEVIVARLTGATRQEGEPFHAGGSGPTMWWNWTPFESGSATISTAGSLTEAVKDLDTVLAVYTLDAENNLTVVAQNDDVDDQTITSKVTFDAVKGTTYYIAVGGYAADDTGVIVFSVPRADSARPEAAPAVLLHPLSYFTPEGDDAVFIVGNGGSPTPSIQWQRSTDGGVSWTDLANGPGVSGVDELILNLSGVAASQNGERYRARLSNSGGTATSIAATLGVLPRPSNDNFVAAIPIPAGVGVISGGSYGATTEANEPSHDSVGKASVWWTWEASGNGRVVFDTAGSNFDTVLAVYTGNSVDALSQVAANDDFGDSLQSKVDFVATVGTVYRIAVSGYLGDFGSIRLQTPSDIGPSIALPPASDVRVTSGGTITISAAATGNPAPTYQWERSTDDGASWNALTDGNGFSGTTTGTLLISGADVGLDGNQFRVQVTNPVATVTSAPSTLAVHTPVVQMTNLSTRAISLGGDSVIIPGFVIEGAQTKRVLVRAVGPKLQDFGVANFLPDPTLSVFRQGESAAIATNDNWGTQEPGRLDPAVEGGKVGAFALTPDGAFATNDTLSAAIVLDLAPGAYSTIARDKTDRTGVGIVEIYDLGTANAGQSRLVNVSNRGYVGTGTEVMIPGFVVEGVGPRRYLIRAVGPKLADFGLPANTLLSDPVVTVQSGSTEVARNDDWVVQDGTEGTAIDVETISAQIGAFALGPDATFTTDDQSSAALIVWLDPGAYTVVVSSADGGTGLVIAEIYEVP